MERKQYVDYDWFSKKEAPNTKLIIRTLLLQKIIL
jgi:hypothetical protein